MEAKRERQRERGSRGKEGRRAKEGEREGERGKRERLSVSEDLGPQRFRR